MKALALAVLLAGAALAAPPDRAAQELERYKASLDLEIATRPWEPEAYLARSGYFMHVKNWNQAAEDWLEGRRLWISKNHGGLGIRAPDRAVTVVAHVMKEADAAGLDPDLVATRFLESFPAADED